MNIEEVRISGMTIKKNKKHAIESIIDFERKYPNDERVRFEKKLGFWRELTHYADKVLPSVLEMQKNYIGKAERDNAVDEVFNSLEKFAEKLEKYEIGSATASFFNDSEWKMTSNWQAEKSAVQYDTVTGKHNLPPDFMIWDELYPGALRYLVNRYLEAMAVAKSERKNLTLAAKPKRVANNTQLNSHISNCLARLWKKYAKEDVKPTPGTRFMKFSKEICALLKVKCPSPATIKKYL